MRKFNSGKTGFHFSFDSHNVLRQYGDFILISLRRKREL